MSTTSTKDTSQTSQPWNVQQPFLTSAFNQANTLNSTGQYTGNQVAQFNPNQLNTFQSMLNSGGNSSVPGQTAGVGGQLAGSGANATQGALSSLGAFKPQGGTQSNIDAANQYADAAASPAAVQAAMRDATRQVSEQALPQIARDSANSGNAMSSRRGISEGIVERGLADKTADTSATMHQQAFNSGLNLAEQNSQSNNSAMLQAMQAQGSLGSSAVGQGVGALGNSITQQGQLYDMAQQGGAGQQAATQAGYDNSKAMAQSPWDSLMKYYGIVGGQNWGGTKTGTEASTPSTWSTIGSGLSTGAQLGSMFV